MFRKSPAARQHTRPWLINSLEPRLMLAGEVGAASVEISNSDASQLPTAPSDEVNSGTIVFVDSSVADILSVENALSKGATLVLLDPNEDGVVQIRKHLDAATSVHAVHIVSHGAAGQLQLGSTLLSAETLSEHAANLRGWSKRLASDADILLYACDVASNDAGKAFLRDLSKLCQADVAASDDRTANREQHGDWELEFQVGHIESGLALTQEAMEAYQGYLAIEIRAASSMGDELLQVQIGDQVVSTLSISNTGVFQRQYTSYFVDLDGVNVNQIRLSFINDAYNPSQGIDRNIGIDWIRVDGVQYETEAPSVFSTGTWEASSGVTPGFKRSEILHASGYFAFGGNNDAGSTIRVFASGNVGSEEMRLLINEQEVATYKDVPQGGAIYTYQANQNLTANQVRIAFTNDLVQGTLDRNLSVDRIEIDGVTYQTEATSTFSSGVFVNGVGITSGFLQTETLHANGYFQFGLTTPPQASTSIAFEADNYIVRENEGGVTLSVVRQGDLSQVSTVNYRVPGGFAVANQDYVPTSGTLTFNPGESRKNFSVVIINDNVAEGQETFTVELSSPGNAALGTTRSTIVTINDDDNINPPGSLNVQVPSGFVVQRIGGNANFRGPTGLKIASDGRVFVTEKFGRIYVVENGQRVETPFLDLSSQVYSVGTSQGLAGFALDPNFASNGYIYVFYTTSENGTRFGRLERYTVRSSNRNQVGPSTRFILVGTNASNGFPDGGDIHLVGDMQFGSDGSLLVSYGDAAGSSDTTAVFNSQNLDNLGGVIARINPANGQGYASNPFFTGNLNDVRSKIWAYGLRNPYRFEVRNDGSLNPNDGKPGTLYIGDVQFQGAEELNISRGGENFGWPYFQGNARYLGNENPASFTGPAVAFPRAEAQTSIGGAIIDTAGWPASYLGNYLHADYAAGWIRSFALDDQGNIVGSRGFATGARGITDLEWDPVTGQLYFVALNQANNFSGELYAISFAGATTNTFQPTEITTGSDGVAFAVTASEQVFRRDGNSWTQLPGSFTKIAASNANEVWGIDVFGNASRWDGSQWQSVGGSPVKDIAVSSNGQVWGISSTNAVVQRVGNQWTTIGGTLVDIEVDGNGVVWGVNSVGAIWQRANGKWTQLSGTLVDISIGDDGSIWGVNAQNQVWRRSGNAWQLQNVLLRSISATNANDVWGVDTNGQVRRFDGTTWSFA